LRIDKLSTLEEFEKLGLMCLQEMKVSGNAVKDRVTAKFLPNLPAVLIKMDKGLL
jgi:hypothetical protein